MKAVANHLNNAILGIWVAVMVISALALPNDYRDGRESLRKPKLPLSERQMLARTLLGECGRCGDEEVRWIAHVILNRWRSGRYGEEIADVVTYRRRGVYHFSTWDPRLNKMEAVGPHVDTSAAFRRMLRLGDAAWQERVDPTGGAVNFYHPMGMKPQRKIPKWARGRGDGIPVGGAIFFR